MREFFISDTHFGDENIFKYENRPFENIQQMDEEIIKRWNETVNQEDTVFHLGDFSVYDFEKNKEILSKLNGKKILVMGNHDFHFTPKQWMEMGFYSASEYHIIFKDFFMLSHMPLYVCSNMPYANIYGHVHNNPSYKDFSAKSMCVCCERINYTPVDFKTISDKIKSCN